MAKRLDYSKPKTKQQTDKCNKDYTENHKVRTGGYKKDLATKKQLELLDSMGYEYPIGLTKFTASLTIERLLQKKNELIMGKDR